MNELEYLKKYIHPEDNLEEAIKRLEAGEPVQYIVGDVDFYGNIIKVNKNVLIPRRETEELVEKTIEYIKKLFPNQNISMLDIGTGSGCIPITLKKHFPNSNISAVDISEDALKVAVDNSLSNNVNINFIQSNIFEKVSGKYHCIISNPPYIKEDEEILKEANKYLEDKFIIAFEIGETQGQDILAIAGKYFPTSKLLLEKDLQHLDRFVFIINE